MNKSETISYNPNFLILAFKYHTSSKVQSFVNQKILWDREICLREEAAPDSVGVGGVAECLAGDGEVGDVGKAQ